MKAAGKVTKLVGVATMAALAVGFAAAPAQASPVPPTASPALYGTWVNVNGASNSVKQIVVSPTRIGNVAVDAFGACTPTLCEWGRVPAIVYGANVSSTSGATFQANQRFLSNGVEWSRTTLLGHVVRTSVGLRLSLHELTVFEDGSGRKNYKVNETFKLGEGIAPTKAGYSVAAYQRGTPPALAAGAFGSWKNVNSATNSLTAIKIGGTAAFPVIDAFGACSPTACDWGKVRGIAYGASISSTVGRSVLAPYVFGFKKSQLSISYGRNAKGVEVLVVGEYNEFTDGSARSNYSMTETFVRA
jgi:hypothetical protein